ncbi:YciI family protein [Fictibacillus solisalsi]|uniref:YciI family protein n=1 Tax=Fictibacillus solisalsi TaxID=459525 RepID=UPI000A59FF62
MLFMVIVKASKNSEAGELVAGFILIDVKSREEAIEWAMRMPEPQGHGEGQIALRQVLDAPELTENAEMLAKEAELRELLFQNDRMLQLKKNCDFCFFICHLRCQKN